MAEEEYENSYFTETITKVRDLEEKQRIIKDRILLIGQNLIELKEETHKNTIEIKKELEMLKNGLERLKSFLETASGEFSKFARKELPTICNESFIPFADPPGPPNDPKSTITPLSHKNACPYSSTPDNPTI